MLLLLQIRLCSLFVGVDFFFYFLNCAVSFVNSATSDSDKWLICCRDLKNITLADNKLIVSSEDISKQRNNQRIGSEITPTFNEAECTVTHTHTHTHTHTYIYIYIYIYGEMVNFSESSKMIKVSRKVNELETDLSTFSHTHTHTHIYTYIYIYIYIYIGG